MREDLHELTRELNPLHIHGAAPIGCCHITNDSRECKPGSIYAALPGSLTDGHRFIYQAIDAGAVCIIHELPLSSYAADILYLQVPCARKALSYASSWLYETDRSPIKVVGVTGTDGKSSTCHFIYQLLHAVGIPCSLLTTVSYDDGSGLRPNPGRMTTPEAPAIHRFLHDSLQNGASIAILEASSHALSEKTHRLADLRFSLAVTTTISSEHLDFHGSIDEYIADKLSIYSRLDGKAVAQAGSPYRERMVGLSPEAPLTYGVDDRTADLAFIPGGERLHLRSSCYGIARDMPAPFGQPFFLLDAAAALIAAIELAGRDRIPELVEACSRLQLITGRCNEISFSGRLAVIDYAHTADSFERLFQHYRKQYPRNRFITVFGSAGRRDHGKRAAMGHTAAADSQLVIITNEDPRDEDPGAIYEEITAGVPKLERGVFTRIDDRREAMRSAVAGSLPGDILFFLGKGHESSIVIGEEAVPWDEEAELKRMINREGLWKH